MLAWCISIVISEYFRQATQIIIYDITELALRAGVIGSDVPWLECPACNALTWVITVTE